MKKIILLPKDFVGQAKFGRIMEKHLKMLVKATGAKIAFPKPNSSTVERENL